MMHIPYSVLTKPLLLLLVCQGGTALAHQEEPPPAAEVDFLTPTYQAPTFLEQGATILKVLGGIYLLYTYRMYRHNFNTLKVAAKQGDLDTDKANLKELYDRDIEAGTHSVEEALESEAAALTKRGLYLASNATEANQARYVKPADLPTALLTQLAEARYHAGASLLGSAALHHERARSERYLTPCAPASRNPASAEEQTSDSCHLCSKPLEGATEEELCQCQCNICLDLLVRTKDENGEAIEQKPHCCFHPEANTYDTKHFFHILCVSKCQGIGRDEQERLTLANTLVEKGQDLYYLRERIVIPLVGPPLTQTCPLCREPSAPSFWQAIMEQVS